MTVIRYGQTDQSDDSVIAIVVADTYAELVATATQQGSLGIAKDQVDGVIYQYNGSTWTTVGHSKQALTPPPIETDTHDYNPTGLENATMLRISATAENWAITGLAGGIAGREITIVNVGLPIVFLHESTASAAANRFTFPYSAPTTLASGAVLPLIYDGTDNRWRTTEPSSLAVASTTENLAQDTRFLIFNSPLDSVNEYSNTTISFNKNALAAQTLSGLPTIKRKSADESVTSSSTLQNDDHLILPITTTGIYYFQAMLRWFGSNPTHDVKVGWSVPAGTTMDWGGGFGATSSQSTYLGSPAVIGGTPNLALNAASTDSSGGRGGQFGGVYAGFIFSGGTAGNVILQWAQNTSDIGTLILQKDSILMAYTLVA